MSHDGVKDHTTFEEIFDWVEGSLNEDREIALCQHLAECDECVALSRRVAAMHEGWGAWTAAAHGSAMLQAKLLEALENVELEPSAVGWRDRLFRWREHCAGASEGAVRLLMDEKSRAARAITEGLDAVLRPTPMWAFSAVAPATAVRGAGPDSGMAPVAIAPGDSPAKVAVRGGSQGEVQVRVDKLEPGMSPPLILLLSLNGERQQIKELERPAGASYWIARFRNLPPGDYLVAFEPSDE